MPLIGAAVFVVLAFYAFAGMAEWSADRVLWSEELLKIARDWWEDGNPLLGLFALPLFGFGAVVWVVAQCFVHIGWVIAVLVLLALVL